MATVCTACPEGPEPGHFAHYSASHADEITHVAGVVHGLVLADKGQTMELRTLLTALSEQGLEDVPGSEQSTRGRCMLAMGLEDMGMVVSMMRSVTALALRQLYHEHGVTLHWYSHPMAYMAEARVLPGGGMLPVFQSTAMDPTRRARIVAAERANPSVPRHHVPFYVNANPGSAANDTMAMFPIISADGINMRAWHCDVPMPTGAE